MEVQTGDGARVGQDEGLWAAEDRELLLWLSDRLREEPDPQVILGLTVEALGRRLQVDAAGCAEMDAAAEYATVNREWLSGRLRSRIGRYRLLDFGAPEQVAKLLRGEIDAIADVRTDPRIDERRRAALEAEGVSSHITAPLVAGGTLRFVIFATSIEPRAWTPAETALMQEVSVRTWATLERARALEALRDAEQNQRFLVQLGDRLRALTDPMEVLLAAAETLGRHLGVNRAGYAEVDLDGTLVIGQDWTDGTVKHGTGRRPIASFGAKVVDELEAGVTGRFDDARNDPRVGPQQRPAFEEMSIVAALTVPLVKGGRLVGMLSVHQKHPRTWTEAEVHLVQEVAERTWAALERARAELALRASEQQFRQMVNNLPALCWMADADGRPFWFNRRWCEYFGLEDETAPEWDSLSSLDPAARPEIEARWAQSLSAQEPFDMTLSLRGKDGAARTFLTRVEPVRDSDGRVARWLGMNTDVTEQIEAERTRTFLLALEDRLRPLTLPGDIVEAVSEALGRHVAADRAGYSEVDEDAGVFMIERAWNNGRLPDLHGRFPLDSFGPEIIDSLRRGETFVCHDVATDERVGELYRAAYEAIGIAAIVTRPLLKDDRLVGIMAVNHSEPRAWSAADVRMVSEVAERAWASLVRARAESRLRESQALLAAFMENAPVGMYLKDADGRYLLANSGMERLFGRPASEAIGLTADQVFPADMAQIATQQDALALIEGRAQVTYQLAGKGEGGWTLIIRFPIDVGGATGVRIGGFAIDIDEQKKAELELSRSREALYQSEKLTALGSLLAGVSHELNNPLAVVVGQSMMLEEEAEGGDYAERAAKIRRAAERCAKIVQTFLAMARQKPPAKTLVEANAVVRGALELTEYGLRTAGVRVETSLEADLPVLSADADQLHQVVANLLINAQHALQGVAGVRELRVSTRRGAAPGTVEIEVADSGPGVAPEVRRRIFEPFFTTKPQGLGTGLGLSFSHGVIESHGGRIELLDRPAGGAVFLLTLPSAADARAAKPKAVTASNASARGSALVIDDEPEIVDMLAELLRRQGYAVSTAASGREGQARLQDGDFDVVLSDLRMPDVDGPALFDWIESTRPDLRNRIGFITGDTLGPAAAGFLAKAGRPYLEKPFTPKAVREFVSGLDRGGAEARP